MAGDCIRDVCRLSLRTADGIWYVGFGKGLTSRKRRAEDGGTNPHQFRHLIVVGLFLRLCSLCPLTPFRESESCFQEAVGCGVR